MHFPGTAQVELPLLPERVGDQGDGVKRIKVESEVDTPDEFV